MPRRAPGLCYHKGQRRYYCTLDGKEVYLGPPQPKRKVPPVAVQREYDRLVGLWLTRRATAPEPVAARPSITELCNGYSAAARARYTRGAATESGLIRKALEVVEALYGPTPAEEFGTKALAVVRDAMAAKWERGHCNKQLSRVRGMFRWAVEQELVGEAVWLRLKTVRGLTRGQGVREGGPVPDVPDAVIEATLAFMPSGLNAMVQVHRLIGCRSDEVCQMTAAMIERLPDPASPTGETWRYTPAESKTGESYWVGPRAQAVLLPLMEAAGPLFRSRRGTEFTRGTYGAAVRLAAQKAEQPHWSPLMVRHRAAEEARQGHLKGVEATQARLRHKNVSISQVYAQNRDELGKDVARRFG